MSQIPNKSDTKNYVLDSSVIVKWFIDEVYSENAIKLRDQFIAGQVKIHVPDLIFYEVINALRYSSLFDSAELKHVSESLIDYSFTRYHWNRGTAKRAIEMVNESNTTIYDMYFLAIAEQFGFNLITADSKFKEKVRELPAHHLVKHIKNY